MKRVLLARMLERFFTFWTKNKDKKKYLSNGNAVFDMFIAWKKLFFRHASWRDENVNYVVEASIDVA
jgi:hypothetical protein